MARKNRIYKIPDTENSNFESLYIIAEHIAAIGRLKSATGPSVPIVQLVSGMSIFINEQTFKFLLNSFDELKEEPLHQVWYTAFPPVPDDDEDGLDKDDPVPV